MLQQPGLSQGQMPGFHSCRACSLTRRSWSPCRPASGLLPPAHIACCRDGCHHCGRRGSAVIADHIPPNKLVFGGTRTQFEKGLNERAKVFTRDLGRGSHSVTRLLRATNKALNIELGEEPPAGLCGRKAASAASKAASGLNSRRHESDSALSLCSLLRVPIAPVPLTGPVPQRYFPQCRRCSGRQAIAARAGKRTLVVHYGGIKPWYFAGVSSWHMFCLFHHAVGVPASCCSGSTHSRHCL